MATPALPPQKLISVTSNQYMSFCQKCRRALPLEYFQKNDMTLKTCYQCRDATQVRRRSDRKKVKAYNEFMAYSAQSPSVARMSVEDILEETSTIREPVARPFRIATTKTDGHSLLQLPPDIPDLRDSSDAENDSPDSDSSSSEEDASPSVEQIKSESEIVTEEKKQPITELREMFEQLKVITDRGTEMISLLEKETKIPDHQMTPSSKMSIEQETKSTYESTTYGSEDEDDSEISGPNYFVCLHCSIPRSIGLQYDDDVCAYCYEMQRYCVQGDHEAAMTDFVDCDGATHDVCNKCRVNGEN